MILSAEGLRYAYPGGVAALKGLDLDVPRGGRLVILGPNGAGKTTLLLHLNGTLRPSAGTLMVDNRPAAWDRRSLTQWRSMVGLVLQDPDDQLFAGTVYQDISFGPLNLGLSNEDVRQRVEDALAAMRIDDLADRPIHMLSGGQKKRVAIAGVLAMRPKVLVLDEPTAGLDSHGVSHLLAALGHLTDNGTTIVYSTHDVDLACAWSDSVAIFHDGVVIGHGEAREVLTDGDLLRRAHLRRPLVLDVGLAVRESGLLADDIPLPRSRTALLALLKGMQPGGPSQEAPGGCGEVNLRAVSE